MAPKKDMKSATKSTSLDKGRVYPEFKDLDNPVELSKPSKAKNREDRLRTRLTELGYKEMPKGGEVLVLQAKHYLQSYSARLKNLRDLIHVREGIGAISEEEKRKQEAAITTRKRDQKTQYLVRLKTMRNAFQDNCAKLGDSGEQKAVKQRLQYTLGEINNLIQEYEAFCDSQSVIVVQPNEVSDPNDHRVFNELFGLDNAAGQGGNF